MTRIYLSPPHVFGDERALVTEAFDSNWIAPLGPHVTAFEKEMCAKLGAGHACGGGSFTLASGSGRAIFTTS
jgi:dTDP-4-amino-4,6-dideoxygalactose transaminase